ncbi:MAG: LmeA family phospholipid-binding protein [Fimbriimonadales bacterium]|nr:LmeA family phospholipid-binding protein [Fimbriimonadales bacterium]
MRREWLAVIAILLTVGRSAVREIEKTAAREIQQRIGGGEFQIKIKPDLGGLPQGRIQTLTVYARNFTLNGLPFTLEPERPKSGVIRQFVLRMENANLRGLRAETAAASIPDVYYDRSLALSRRIFRLSATGVGACEIVVNEADLAAYIARKYAPAVRQVQVQIAPEQTTVQGVAFLLANEVRFRAVGKLAPRDGRYLDLAEVQIEIEGTNLPPESANLLRQFLNPIIDIDRDLGLYDGLAVDHVVSEPGRMKAIGRVWIPRSRESGILYPEVPNHAYSETQPAHRREKPVPATTRL